MAPSRTIESDFDVMLRPWSFTAPSMVTSVPMRSTMNAVPGLLATLGPLAVLPVLILMEFEFLFRGLIGWLWDNRRRRDEPLPDQDRSSALASNAFRLR
jgi:hypothetical protein